MQTLRFSLFALASLVVGSVALTGLGGCSVSSDLESGSAESTGVESEGEVVDEDSAAASTSPVSTFYRVRRDYRRCAAPMCGGVFYKKLNAATTKCSDGSSSTECYAATVVMSGTAASVEGEVYAGTAIVRGRITTQTIVGRRWAKFSGSDAWRALTATVPETTRPTIDPQYYQ